MPVSKSGILSKAEIEQRQSAAIKHGAGSARNKLMAGEAFGDIASEVYHRILARWGHTDAELQRSGIIGDLIKETARHMTVTDMFWMLMLGAAESGQADKWEVWYRHWRTVSNRGISHMKQLQEMIENDRTLDYEQILHSQSEQALTSSESHQDGR